MFIVYKCKKQYKELMAALTKYKMKNKLEMFI